MKALIATATLAATLSAGAVLVVQHTITVSYEPPPPVLSSAPPPPPVVQPEPFDYERHAREVARAIEAERAEAERVRLAALQKKDCDFWGSDFKAGC